MIKKICFFSTCFAVHKRIRMEYAEKYLPENIELFLLTPPKHNKYNLKRTNVIEVEGNKFDFTLTLRKFCKENKIDLLVNLGTSNESFGMFFATFGIKTEYIVNEIGNIWEGLKLQKNIIGKSLFFVKILFLAISFMFAKKIIYSSSDVCNKSKKYFFFIKNKIKQAPFILDENFFIPKNKIETRKKLGLPINKEIILSVGRIFYLKGSDILLELIKKNPEKLFILIGEIIDPNYKNQRAPNLLLLSPVKGKKLVDYYNSADLFIFPSRVEAYGLVQREAMLCETPALISDIPALRLTKHALKAKPNAEKMQEQIARFFLMPKNKRERLGKIGRDYVIKTNSYKNLENNLRNLLIN